MNVLLIAQCRKRALTQTRRILDQFAERRGDCTWQTTITEQGLATLHRLLRSSARKNTAVACHWIRGKDHSEVLWVVGDARQFNPCGATPTNVTRRDVLRAGDENDWHSAETIRLLARLAALLHDIGKANGHFQKKLRSRQPLIDAYRHEWLSLRLFEALVGDDDDAGWLQRLADTQQPLSAECLRRLRRDSATPPAGSPFSRLPPLARLVGWLIVSHHRLPTPGN
ncbi:MAG TPA: HD domain-containing protein, partial [Accumulibacter sp.]|nr:HD domain-containing protein [Accumulibacter sp.]